MPDEVFIIDPKENRQAQIERADIGDSVSLARRIDLQFGLPDGAISKHTKQVRGIIDQQVHRARRRYKDRGFTVENGCFLTRDGALMVVAVCTRTN